MANDRRHAWAETANDHLRNHALLAKGRDWQLSPAYDLTPIPVVARDRRNLAMACGPAGRLANKANLLGAAGRFLLVSAEAEAIFDHIADTIRQSWHPTMRRAHISEQDCEAKGLLISSAARGLP